ncbi:MAG: hypothetical protein H6581_05315 [Bacteroidia bacterium]|nr:hypothetical protein [Bacteroidia bacterium]
MHSEWQVEKHQEYKGPDKLPEAGGIGIRGLGYEKSRGTDPGVSQLLFKAFQALAKGAPKLQEEKEVLPQVEVPEAFTLPGINDGNHGSNPDRNLSYMGVINRESPGFIYRVKVDLLTNNIPDWHIFPCPQPSYLGCGWGLVWK